MFTPLVRKILIAFCLGMSIFFYSQKDYVNVGLMLLSAVLFLYGYFKYGTVYAAFQQLKKNNFKKAEKLILKVKNPNNLNKENKSYYHFSMGLIASEKEKWDLAYEELTKSLEIGLRTKNDTSILLLNLADVEFERKKFNEAESYLNKLEEFELKPLIKEESDKLLEKVKAIKQDNH